jgi:hypothetical protein
MPESALIVAVPEAGRSVGSRRQRSDATARLGVPAHLTVRHPFLSPALIGASVRSTIGFALVESTAVAGSWARAEHFPP